MAKRIPRVNQLIKKELSQIILREIEFPQDVLVTVTRVETSGNLIETKVYVSSMPSIKSKEIISLLNRNIYNLQQMLNRRLKMRPIPKIIFIEEKETQVAGRVEEILTKIKKQERKS